MESLLLRYKHTWTMVIISVFVSLIISAKAGSDGFEMIQRQFKKSVYQFSFNVSVQEKMKVVSALNCFVQCRQLTGCLGVQYRNPTSSCTKYRLSNSTLDPPVAPGPGVWYVSGSYKYVGCFTDEEEPARTLKGVNAGEVAGLTTEMCWLICINYSFFGTEFAHECFCGDVINSRAGKVGRSRCGMPCEGDPSTKCGDNWMISIYKMVP